MPYAGGGGDRSSLSAVFHKLSSVVFSSWTLRAISPAIFIIHARSTMPLAGDSSSGLGEMTDWPVRRVKIEESEPPFSCR